MNLAEFKGSVGFLGAGNMATALVAGMIRGGLPPARIAVTDLDGDKVQRWVDEWNVTAPPSASDLASSCSTIIFAVKPAGVLPLATSLRPQLEDQLWVSIAAGVTSQSIEQALGSSARVVRAMPNTPALVGEGATGIAGGVGATSEDLELVRVLLGSVGPAEILQESMMDALTGLSGSGPAFVFLMLEALADGAVHQGLPRATALRFAAQTVRGAATLLLESGKHPGELKDMVTSPGGTTIHGVEALEAGGFRKAVMNAVIAAAQRSRKLSE